ncbi:2Fe-2S iron-sulfur cluster-binding protein [Pseudonocardia eucalypti]|uniref:2Fe-2S iron-sulfur cluster-binding protein n=1 Tax=Pseudonocardia eucalypti TaxID=648755 RepID=A0ABP9QNA0_9PSEU|nr:carbon-monoxide dehydrogenase small subunit [Pseudonocardia eucalypti]
MKPRERVSADEQVDVPLTVNGRPTTLTVSPRMHLADALRRRPGLTGTHLGCEHGVCGMCTVLVDGEAARACLLLAVQCEGADVVTVEGLGPPDRQHPLQRAFAAHHALQCGFCTPGMLLSGYDLLANHPAGTALPPDHLPTEMSGVLCRCTGYRAILAAIADVAARHPSGLPPPARHRAPNSASRGFEHGESGIRVQRVADSGTALEPGHDPAGPLAPRPYPDDLAAAPSGPPTARVRVRAGLSAPVDAVWRVLDDFARLAECLPGAELTESLPDDRYRGRASVALGPVKLTFDGMARRLERDPKRHRLRVLAKGTDTGGSATMADIRLAAEPAGTAPDPEPRTTPVDGSGTVLRAEVDLYLSGRIAQFGRALAGDVSRRMFQRFAAEVDRKAGGRPVTATRRSLRGWLMDLLRRRR